MKMTMHAEGSKIERLKQKIITFNKLMGEISHEFSDIILLGKEDKFHDLLMEMLQGLHNAQKTVKKAYYLFEKRNDTKEPSPMTSDVDKEKLTTMKEKLQEYTMFMDSLSEELNTKFFEGKHAEFQETVEDMIESLDKTRESTKKAYFQAFGKDKTQKGFRGSGGGP